RPPASDSRRPSMKTLRAFALIFLALTAGAQTVTVSNANGRCGQRVTVPLSIDNASGMLSLEFRIAYDTNLLAIADVTAGTLTSNFAMSWNATGGVLHVAMASGTPVSGAGTVANIAINVSQGAT